MPQFAAEHAAEGTGWTETQNYSVRVQPSTVSAKKKMKTGDAIEIDLLFLASWFSQNNLVLHCISCR